MTERAELIARRINDRVAAICEAVPPITPEGCYWFHSDASESFCREHVIVERGKVFELGPPLEDRWWYHRTEMEEAFFEDIGCSTDSQSDHTEACTTCGKTLSYILTEEGVDSELEFYREAPLVMVRPEDSYALDRLALNVWYGMERHRLLGVAAVVNQAYRLIRAEPTGE